MKKALDSAPCDNANSCGFNDAKQILREFGYKLGRYDVLGNKGVESALDSATRAIKNNMRVNKVILLLWENMADLAQDSANSYFCHSERNTKCEAKNLKKPNRDISLILNTTKMETDSANRRIYKQARNLTQNGVEIIVFLENSAEAKFGIDFWRKFGIVYLLKD